MGEVIQGDIVSYDPRDIEQKIRWSEEVQSLLPPDGYYFIVIQPDGNRQIAYSQQEVEKIAKPGSLVVREITRKGLLTLALATGTQAVSANASTRTEVVGNFIVQVTQSEYETLTVWLRSVDLLPVAAFCNVVVSSGRVVMPGSGAAFATERRFSRPGDVIALAETRAINRALESVLGGGSVSEEFDAPPPVIPANLDQIGFIRIVTQYGVPIAEALARLGVSSLTEISDFAEAARRVLGV